MPTGDRKLEKLSDLLGKLGKSYRKAIGRSITGLQLRQILMVTIRRHEWITQRQGQRKKTTTSFSAFFGDNSSHQINQKHSSAKSCCARCARSRMSFYAANRFRESSARRKRLMSFFLLEKTRIRNVRSTSKHFPTTKVDFLTIKVVFAIMRTITLFRNATDDLRSESEGLAYEYRPYMQFSVFRGAGSGGRV